MSISTDSHSAETQADRAPCVARTLADALEANLEKSIQSVLCRARDLGEQAPLADDASALIPETDVSGFLEALVEDLREESERSRFHLVRMILPRPGEGRPLLAARLLCMATRCVALARVEEVFAAVRENRIEAAERVRALLDAADLELSLEYERRLWEASRRARRAERMARNTPEPTQRPSPEASGGGNKMSIGGFIDDVLDHTRLIEQRLSSLDRKKPASRSHEAYPDAPLSRKRYGEGLSMVDVD